METLQKVGAAMIQCRGISLKEKLCHGWEFRVCVGREAGGGGVGEV